MHAPPGRSGTPVAILEERPDAGKSGGRGGAERATPRVLAAYLALTLPFLALGGPGGAHTPVLAAHAAVAVALLGLDRRRAAGRAGAVEAVLGDWAPLLLVPLLYAELPLLMEGLPGPVRYHDPRVAGLEGALFGAQPAFEWAGAWPSRLLSELLHACYLSYYPLIYLPPLLLYLGGAGGRRDGFHETALALTVSFLACFAVFVVFPVQGPRYLGVPAGVPAGPVRTAVLAVLEGGSSRGAAFPSSHVAVAVTQSLLALRHQPRVGRVAALVSVGLAAGAVYGGFHYAVDALAGAVVGALAVPLAGALRRRAAGAHPGFTSTPGAV